MKKNIQKAVLFLLLIVGALYGVQLAIDYAYRKRVSNKFTHLLRHQVDPQVIIFGSSVVYHQFNPLIIDSITGKTVYNMGWPGMFFIQYGGLINEYLSYEKNCQYMVLGCDFDNLGRTEFSRNPNLFFAYLGNENIYNSLHNIEPQKMLMAKYLPGYKLTLLGKPFYMDILLGAHYKDSMAGFEPLGSEWEAGRPSAAYHTRYEEGIFIAFQKAVADIKARGIKVILVIPPVYKDGYQLIQNAAMIKAKYASLAGDGVYFIDYTADTLCNHQEYFHNFTHLNGSGANVFSHTFAQDLLKIIHEHE